MRLPNFARRMAQFVRAALSRAQRSPAVVESRSVEMGPLSRRYLEATRQRLSDADRRSVVAISGIELQLRDAAETIRSLPTSRRGARTRALEALIQSFDRMLSPEAGELMHALRAHPARGNDEMSARVVAHLTQRAAMLLSLASEHTDVARLADQLELQASRIWESYAGSLPESCREAELLAVPDKVDGLTTRAAAARLALHLQAVTQLLAARQNTLHVEVQRLTKSMTTLEPGTLQRRGDDLESAFKSLSEMVRETARRRVRLSTQSVADAADLHVSRLERGGASPFFRRGPSIALVNQAGKKVQPSPGDRELLVRANDLARYAFKSPSSGLAKTRDAT